MAGDSDERARARLLAVLYRSLDIEANSREGRAMSRMTKDQLKGMMLAMRSAKGDTSDEGRKKIMTEHMRKAGVLSGNSVKEQEGVSRVKPSKVKKAETEMKAKPSASGSGSAWDDFVSAMEGWVKKQAKEKAEEVAKNATDYAVGKAKEGAKGFFEGLMDSIAKGFAPKGKEPHVRVAEVRERPRTVKDERGKKKARTGGHPNDEENDVEMGKSKGKERAEEYEEIEVEQPPQRVPDPGQELAQRTNYDMSIRNRVHRELQSRVPFVGPSQQGDLTIAGGQYDPTGRAETEVGRIRDTAMAAYRRARGLSSQFRSELRNRLRGRGNYLTNQSGSGVPDARETIGADDEADYASINVDDFDEDYGNVTVGQRLSRPQMFTTIDAKIAGETNQNIRAGVFSATRRLNAQNSEVSQDLAGDRMGMHGGDAFLGMLQNVLDGKDPMEAVDPAKAKAVAPPSFGQDNLRLRHKRNNPLVIGLLSNSPRSRLPLGRTF